ncbi:ATP-binding cassette domain-containing protein [Microbacterium suwonense]|uniref:ABC transporter ATP-binding protein n=1 Tax=Microbacterium suwonense TaxID=683047 RepID=A0ABM8FUS4_9MICO|nr:ATP-binding cassette domain-containing protein [Microbacterium suwonense]BDZ39443.1 ABC transporter ATP-binding protein [Microbacterium suwonense]
MHELTKRYGRITAVDGLDFRVRPGVVTGFLGPNGAGKSTTLRMILGLDRPSAGIATIHGRRISELHTPMRVVGALLNAHAVHPRRSGFDHLQAFARLGGIPRARVEETLERVGLAAAAKRPAGDYSLGMMQRLGIATALIGEPSIVIFDEPLNGLDPDGIRWARGLMRDLAAEGRTVLFSSHLLNEMELTADHLLVIHHGRLVADEPLRSFLDARMSQWTIVRSPQRELLRTALSDAGLRVAPGDGDELVVGDADTDRIGSIAASARIEVSELTTRRDSLENVFLRMTAASTEKELRA